MSPFEKLSKSRKRYDSVFEVLVAYIVFLLLGFVLLNKYRNETPYKQFVHYIQAVSFVLLLTYLLYQIT